MKKTDSGDKKRKKSIYRQVLYHFDNWLSKGTLSTIILLFAVTGVLVLIIALLAVIFGGQESLGNYEPCSGSRRIVGR